MAARIVFTVIVDVNVDDLAEGEMLEGDSAANFLAREISATRQAFDAVTRVVVTTGLSDAKGGA